MSGVQQALLMVSAAGGGGSGSTTTWSPTDKVGVVNLSNADMTATFVNEAGTNKGLRSSVGYNSGKHYFEVNADALGGGTTTTIGLLRSDGSLTFGTANSYRVTQPAGDIEVNNVPTGGTVGAQSNGDVLMCAFDMTAMKVWFGRNGTWQGDPAAGTGGTTITNAGTYMAWANQPDSVAEKVLTLNCGAVSFTHTMPSGFSAL